MLQLGPGGLPTLARRALWPSRKPLSGRTPRLALVGAFVFSLSGCTPAATPVEIRPTIPASPPQRPSPTSAKTRTPRASATLPPTLAASSAPENPPGFATAELRPGVEGQTYLADACQYLQRKWDPDG